MQRPDGRTPGALRPVKITKDYTMYAEGSVLVEMGNTKVICTASVENKVPPFLEGKGLGWVTAEYAMLPRATQTRVPRESKKPSGRSEEIKRLVGRALRGGVDLAKMPGISVLIDCDVIQADGGTRTASVTGGFVALYQALNKLVKEKRLAENPVREFVAAVSCGICGEAAVLDVDYREDSTARADTNFVLTESGKIIEIQGTAEGEPIDEVQFAELMALARQGIAELIEKQKQALGVEA